MKGYRKGFYDQRARRVDENEAVYHFTGSDELLGRLEGDDATCRPTLDTTSDRIKKESGVDTYSKRVWPLRLSSLDLLGEMYSHTRNAACVFFRRLHIWGIEPINT